MKFKNPNTKFIIFTSAVTSDLLVSIIKNGNRIYEYERWLKELIEVFGEVNHFMIINTFTGNSDVPQNFEVLVKKENINEHLENLRKQIEEYDLSKLK